MVISDLEFTSFFTVICSTGIHAWDCHISAKDCVDPLEFEFPTNSQILCVTFAYMNGQSLP